MNKKFLKHLVCPECRGELKLKEFKIMGQEVEEGLLSCACGGEYPIIKGVPRLLPKRFKGMLGKPYADFFAKHGSNFSSERDFTNHIEEKSSLEKEKQATASAFGKKWQQFAEMRIHHEEQFLDWIWPVNPSLLKDKIILDAGCGQGRHAYFAAKYAAKAVFGVDLSEAVDAAYRNTKHFENVCIIQGDIYHLPFKEKTFDYAYSIGVLHHLPNPKAGFDEIIKLIRQGGTFSIWVYGSQSIIIRTFNTLREKVLSKLPLQINYFLSWLVTLWLYPIIKCIYKPLNSFKPTHSLAKRLPQNSFFMYLSNLDFRMVHEIIYDQAIAPTAFYYTREELEKWFKHPEIESYQISERNKNSWRGLAKVR
jgi:SAM-dependent methyltransferase